MDNSIDWHQMVLYAGGFVGAVLSALALRLGWKNGGKELSNPSETIEIKSAIVDSSSIKVLSASIEGLGFNLLEFKKLNNDQVDENHRLLERLITAIEGQTEEVRMLAREIRDHAREVSKRS